MRAFGLFFALALLCVPAFPDNFQFWNPYEQTTQGNWGTGQYFPTGQTVTTPDGNIAQEFHNPFDTESTWLIWFTQPTITAPPPWPYSPLGIDPPFTWPSANDVLKVLTNYHRTSDPTPTWTVDPTPNIIDCVPPQLSQVPEPSTYFQLLAALGLLMVARMLNGSVRL